MESGKKFKVLIVKPSSLGDIFHLFPAIAILTAGRPEAEIDWIVNPAFADVLKYCPNIRRVIFFRRKELGSLKTFFPYVFRLISEIRHEDYDLVIDFQGLFRSAFFAWIARCRQIAGFASPKEPVAKFFYTSKIVVPDSTVHAVDKNIRLMQQLLHSSQTIKTPFLAPVKDFSEKSNNLLLESGIVSSDRVIGIIPGARWQSKCWPPAFFANLISEVDRLHPGLKFIILGSEADSPASSEIINSASNARIISLTGKTAIGELVEIIRRCEFIISNDSGPVHIAAAMNKTVFALFGPTDPGKTGPYGNKHYIFQANLPCIKCLKRKCPRGTFDCHKLEIDKITDKLIKFVNNGAVNENVL